MDIKSIERYFLDSYNCETLIITISSSLQGALLVEKLQEKERLLNERTIALTNNNQELEQFANMASHDLQEPLRMVIGYLQLIERRYKGKLDADADDFIEFAVNGAIRMQNLINDLLVYSRVSSGQKPYEKVDFNDIISQVSLNLKIAIEERQALVTYNQLPTTIMADPGQMIQLFQNLIANAIKFQKEQQPMVHIDAVVQNNGWLFSVRDNGIGIDMQHAERIFLIFQRLHNREEYPGTGIGLSVCQKIVEQHNGRIWVESVPGKGATFYFLIRTVDR